MDSAPSDPLAENAAAVTSPPMLTVEYIARRSAIGFDLLPYGALEKPPRCIACCTVADPETTARDIARRCFADDPTTSVLHLVVLRQPLRVNP
jgi:hypothetical protein